MYNPEVFCWLRIVIECTTWKTFLIYLQRRKTWKSLLQGNSLNRQRGSKLPSWCFEPSQPRQRDIFTLLIMTNAVPTLERLSESLVTAPHQSRFCKYESVRVGNLFGCCDSVTLNRAEAMPMFLSTLALCPGWKITRISENSQLLQFFSYSNNISRHHRYFFSPRVEKISKNVGEIIILKICHNVSMMRVLLF